MTELATAPVCSWLGGALAFEPGPQRSRRSRRALRPGRVVQRLRDDKGCWTSCAPTAKALARAPPARQTTVRGSVHTGHRHRRGLRPRRSHEPFPSPHPTGAPLHSGSLRCCGRDEVRATSARVEGSHRNRSPCRGRAHSRRADGRYDDPGDGSRSWRRPPLYEDGPLATMARSRIDVRPIPPLPPTQMPLVLAAPTTSPKP